ncbi:SusC/RagA family TonB-linked outer membrane protein [Sphingobacterium rhinopitheci]|uniref:SusC/RagA family TonB-linked outer membrane protein n=1 Tax=Sphingobacterium rhinopitheci TaxID=2781960 RepID=UPI001F51EA56|nr:SusC/RagA family TonB-linked outer membrane protein [Sphingobacterium rhinopitheci]MCI0921517.1 SusC/RagA family TonB-linked outer membrane protein [Sphingobacterium rhinopitheci]
MNPKFYLSIPKDFLFTLFFILFFSLPAFTQHVVKGKVSDSDGPLAGVSIRSQNNSKVISSTNSDGSFSVTVNDNDVLIFSIVGYQQKQVSVDKKTVINVLMVPLENVLDETIVTGYTTINRAKNTGAIASISSKDIENLPAASIDVLLQGKLPGVNVQNFTGMPGVKTSLVIRGNSNIPRSGSQFDTENLTSNPLYVIDGVPISDDEIRAFNVTGTNFLSSLNPNDIESVDVLKDASSAAQYGSRANNGVIIIKTKRGKVGKPRISINTYQGFIVKPEKLNTLVGRAERDQKLGLLYRYGTYAQQGNLPIMLTDSLNPAFNGNTDYQDLFFRNGHLQNYDLSVAGGTEHINYRISGGYYDEKGIVKNTGFKRYSFTSNVNFNFSKSLELLTNFKVSTMDRKEGRGTTEFLRAGSYRNVYGVNPINMYSSLYQLSDETIDGILNPYEHQRNDNINVDLTGVGELRYSFLNDFRLSTRSIINYSTAKNDFFSPSYMNSDKLAAGKSTHTKYRKYLMTNNLLWTKSFNDVHNFTANFVQEYETRTNTGMYLLGIGIPNDNIQVIKGVGSAGIEGYTDLSSYAKLSYLGAVHYDYDSRYLFDAVWRKDASSRFGKNHKWGNFPSVAAGWIISNESFTDGFDWMNELKLRASWGRTGDESSITDFDRYNAYIPGDGSYAGSGTVNSYGGQTAIIPNYAGITNDDITWQQTETWNLGVDGSFFRNRLFFNIDVYSRETSGQMLSITIPEYTGYTSTFTNAASVRNSGLELNIGGRIFDQEKAFQWTPSINMAFNKNMVTELPNGNRDIYYGDRAVYVVGKPLNMYYGFLVDGAISSSEDIIVNPYTGAVGSTKWGTLKPGYANWVDVNGDYTISDGIGADDRTFFGDSNPKVVGGFNNLFTYKDFSLQVLTTFTFGRDIMNQSFAQRMSNSFFYGSPFDMARRSMGDLEQYNYWKQDGDQADYPAFNPYLGLYTWRTGQSMFMEPGWYVRIKNVNLTYRFNPDKHSWMQRAKLNSLRLYATIDNVMMFQSFSGIDAERVDGQGYDMADGYPLPRKITLGLQFDF